MDEKARLEGYKSNERKDEHKNPESQTVDLLIGGKPGY